jgi:hypothetical protein
VKPFSARSISALALLIFLLNSFSSSACAAGMSRGFNQLLESVVKIDVREIAFEAGAKRYTGGIGSGVILSAAYALWLYRRVMFGTITNPALAAISDLDWREVAIFTPLIVATLVLGVQPGLIFNITQSSVDLLVGNWRAAVGG